MDIFENLSKTEISEKCIENLKSRVLSILEEAGFEHSFTDKTKNGTEFVQGQFFPTAETGRNLAQEREAEKVKKKAEREAKSNQPKNPNRVNGGKKAQETKRINKLKALNDSPLLKAMNYQIPIENPNGGK